VAVLYGWWIGARSFAYMQAFDAAWSRHAVGILLLDHAVRAAEAEGSEVFDMLRGKERHKARFENDQRTVRTYVVVGRGSFARLAIRGRETARRAYRQLPPRHRSALRRLLRRP
jgi:CelD/BcsL family acetyltransferase involved in cellulose biosynthesis